MSSPTTDSPQPPIITYSPQTGGAFLSGEQHRRWTGSNAPEMVGRQFGRYTVISSEIQRINGYKKLLCRCECGVEKWVDVSTLQNGLSKGCRRCADKDLKYSEFQDILGCRYDAITARCNHQSNPAYKHYGGRGIQCKFPSRKHFVLWVTANLPHPTYQGVEIDRVDNDGHYEPGNLRLATRQQQMDNRRNTNWVQFQGQPMLLREFVLNHSPYTYGVTARYAKKGLTGEQIIEQAIQLVANRKWKWTPVDRRLKELGYTTSPTPALDSVTQPVGS